VLCNNKGKSALHMAAQYCESLEVLQTVLQIDHSLTKKRVNGPYNDIETTPLGLLCGRSVKVIYNGVLQCMCQ
jgi:hypothetical protein